MWMKIDDRMHAHRKTRKVLRSDGSKIRDSSPLGLWVLAGSWSAQNNTDGWVPVDELERFDDAWESHARRLVAADYWWPEQRGGEDGYGFVDWHEWNGRDRESADGKYGNHVKWHVNRKLVKPECEYCPSEPESDGDIAPDSPPISPPTRGGESGSIAYPDPTRPVPDPIPTPFSAQARPSKPKKKPSVSLPADWAPTDDHKLRASNDGVFLAKEVEKFRLHAETHDRKAANWNAAFTQWLIKAAEYAERDRPAPRQSRPHAAQLELPPDGLTPEEYAEWEREQRRKRGL